MESDELHLSFKWKGDVYPLPDLKVNSTISDLKCSLSQLINGDLHALSMYIESSEKQVDLSCDNRKLVEIPVNKGDTLVGEKNDEYVNYGYTSPSVSVPSVPSLQMRDPQVVGILPEGVLLRYAMPTNNSCLFASIYFAVSEDKTPLPNYSYLREVIADAVAADPLTYNDAFLGQPNHDYCNWILQEEHWGGAIELSILCKHFGLEMVTIDMQSSRLHHFGENFNYDHRIFLIYNGVHYDALALKPSDPSKPLETVFPVTNEVILQKAKELILENNLGQLQSLDSRRNNCICFTCNQSFCCHAELADHVSRTRHRSSNIM